MVTLRIKGLDELIEGNDEMIARLADMSPVLSIAAQDLKTFVDDRFETSTDPQGDEWHPLEDPTIKKRRKGDAGDQNPTILVDTAILRNSVAASATKKTLKVGTNIDYALFHQLGTESMFERPFIPIISDFRTSPIAGELMSSIREMVRAWVLTGELE